jgi:hypothetical protein
MAKHGEAPEWWGSNFFQKKKGQRHQQQKRINKGCSSFAFSQFGDSRYEDFTPFDTLKP